MFAHVPRHTQYLLAEAAFAFIAVIAAVCMVVLVIDPMRNMQLMVAIGTIFTISLIILIRLWLDPDRIRAVQSNAVLKLASKMAASMSGGLNETSAQEICEALLPATSAIAVAITDDKVIIGYAGSGREYNNQGSPIRTVATHATLDDGRMRVLHSSAEIGFPEDHHIINAGIVAPLIVSGKAVGTLKFYYPRPRNINETQESIAAGFAELLSTQVAASALEEQKKLATSMELKALQSQINPHFLFNTINTIASFVRTDPDKSRVLLREFATFYRRTLEDASDLISLDREVDQTQRYLTFEIARFGEERLQMEADIPSDLADKLVPAFMIQPLVENSVRHAMPARGTLHISVKAWSQGDDLLIAIIDDGVGMSEEKRRNIAAPGSSTGLGIAVRNINERILGYFGPDSYMDVQSEEGKGTTVTLFLKDCCKGLNTPR